MTREEFILPLAAGEIADGRDADEAVAFWAKEWDQSQVAVTRANQALTLAQAALTKFDTKS